MIPRGGWISTTDIYRKNQVEVRQKISSEALANRLNRLQKLGLVESKVPSGRSKFWKRV